MRRLTVVAAAIIVAATLAGCSAGEKPLLDTQPTILAAQDGDILRSLHATLAGPLGGISGVGYYAVEHSLMIPALAPGSCANSVWPLILLDRDVKDTTGEIESGQDVVIGTQHVTQLVRTFTTVQQARDFLSASETALAACPKYTVASKTHITQTIAGARDGGYALDTVSTTSGEKLLKTHRLVIRDANVIFSVSGVPDTPTAKVAQAIQKRIAG
ncbi:MAG: hypothetical protein V4479_10580 [Actinomycetota bacterium]